MKLKHYCTLAAILMLATGCSADNWGNMVSDFHHQDSKFDKYIEQCLDRDLHICEQRYEQLGIE